MSHPTVQNTPEGPTTLASSLLETLEEELTALTRLFDHFDVHIHAVRERRQDLLDDATIRTNDEVNDLARLKQTRDRKIRLLGRVLRLDAENTGLDEIATHLLADRSTEVLGRQISVERDRIRLQAKRTQERCHDLEFALQYAVHLGHELLQTIQGIDSPVATKVYTSQGGAIASSPSTRSFVNRLG